MDEQIRRKRGAVRANFTKLVADFKAELAKDDRDLDLLDRKMKKLELTNASLEEQNEEILNQMTEDGCSEEDYIAEYEAIDKYRDEWLFVEQKHNKLRRSVSPSNFSTCESTSKRRSFKLPKIELKKFDGSLIEWLGWWAQFSKIHEDEELHTTDKFQYLVQSMEPNTRAYNLVKSYPQSSENYAKVIEALKDRFGDKNMLAEVYIRKLQSVVLSLEHSKSRFDLCKVYDDIETQMRCLESLDVTLDHSAFMLPLIESNLPVELIKVWQRLPESGYSSDENITTERRLKSMMEFLRREVKGEERIKMIQGGVGEVFGAGQLTSSRRRLNTGHTREIPTAQSLHVDSNPCCVFCGKRGHNSQDCWSASSLSVEERSKRVRDGKLCFACLKPGHQVRKCKALIKCVVCQKKHYPIMCNQEKPSSEEVKQPVPIINGELSTVCNASQSSMDNLVLMKTVRVNVLSPNGKKLDVRLMFDEGSNRSYIKSAVAKKMECVMEDEVPLQTTLFGGSTTSVRTKKRFRVDLESLDQLYFGKFIFISEENICGSCPTIPKGPWMSELKRKNICVNDTNPKSTDIDILIGSNLWPQLMTGKMAKLSNGLIAVQSVFGWTLSGELRHERYKTPTIAATTISLLTQGEKSLSELWNLESIGIQDPMEKQSVSEHNTEVVKKFIQGIEREDDGRYKISLPWIDRSVVVPNNRFLCEKRLQSTTSSLEKRGTVKQYDQIIREWKNDGIIELCSPEKDSVGHYLPHHPVYKMSSSTTPVRPVFDASARVGKSLSLNQCLEKGPNLLELIPSILLRFRMKNVGIISDIRKAFQMVSVTEEDRNYQKFLWWEDPEMTEKKIQEYRHRRVVFGMNCSPFILAAVLDHHLSCEIEKGSESAEVLKKSFYVDNSVTSVDTVEDYKKFKPEAIAILASAKMDLRQWESNVETAETENTTVLGLRWCKTTDELSCIVEPINNKELKVTKRSVLSIVAKVFDPIGYLGPALIEVKKLLQESWTLDVSWDEEWTGTLLQRFLRWYGEIDELSKIKIPRVAVGTCQSKQVHLFTDASKDAYAAVIYVRVDRGHCVDVQLLLSKSRLAPLSKSKTKKMTIPRLELMGAVIGVRLLASVMCVLEDCQIPVFCWTDSSTVLAWIHRDERWGTFVGNRVREINQCPYQCEWRHVPGQINPADLPSRGTSPYELRQSKWWEGPSWLHKEHTEWPQSKVKCDEDLVQAEKLRSEASCAAKSEPVQFKFSSYWKNVRVAAWIRRFIANCRVKNKMRLFSSCPTREEMKLGESDLIRKAQKYLDTLGLKRMKLKRREDGVWCLATKLEYRRDRETFKLPIVLPSRHPFTEQLIEFAHKCWCHSGTQFLLNKLREKYWILQGRRTVDRIVRSCVVCKRFAVKPVKCESSSLPVERVDTVAAFQTTGVDLAGPIILKGVKKVWIVIFTCAVYRGVHLDLVDSLSAEEFLDCLHRFVCQVGRPTTFVSDNGTNFVGSVSLMKRLNWKLIESKSQVKQIRWRFNPPSAAWWGGWWERLIGSLKDLLRKMVGRAKLTRKELVSCLAEISYVMNTRPLTTLTENSEDLIPLTPFHFMRDLPIGGLPEAEMIDGASLQAAYQKMCDIKCGLRERFRKEYLGLLVQKKSEVKSIPKVGDIVLVGSDNKKRYQWPLGRIIEVMAGKDGKCRVARVKTNSGIYIRPMQRLYPLEIPANSDLKRSVNLDAMDESFDVAKEDNNVCTRSGRIIRKPGRYSAWNY